MKKQLVLWLFLPLMAFTAFDWVTVNIGDRVSVDFPVKPEQKDMSGNAVWIADEGSDARCMAMVVDFEKFGMDSAMVTTEMAKPESYNDFKNGVLGQIPGSTMTAEKITTIQGYRTFDFLIDMGKKDTSALNIMYNKNIFVGAKMYTLSFFEKTGKPQEAIRNKFFNSFKVK